MANVHINRAGQNLGIFSDDEVRSGLRSGRFAGTDLAWREGMATWQPLSQFSEFATEVSAATSAAATTTVPGAAPAAAAPSATSSGPTAMTTTPAASTAVPAVRTGRTEPLAIWSLVLSCLSLVCCGFIIGIPGVICGHIALSKIRAQPGLEGRGMAMAGLIIGYAAIAFWVVWGLFFGGIHFFQSLSHSNG